MKKMAFVTATVFAAGLVLSTGAFAAEERSSAQGRSLGEQSSQPGVQQQRDQAGSQQIGAGQQQVSAQQQQIQAADQIQGFKVQNQQGENLGEVAELLIDVQQGKVGYAVVSSGGVLGMGEQKFIVPFNALKLDAQQNVLTLDMDKERLKQAPQGDIQQAMDQQTGRQIHQFYGVSPYWEEGAQQQEIEQDQMQMQRDQMQQQDRPQQQQRERL